MNQVALIGRLARDPELAYTQQNQTACCKFTIAVNRMRREDPADFIRIVTWGKIAENCNQYLAKGRQVGIAGRIQTGSYTNDKGDKVYTTDVVASNVEFLGGSNGSGDSAAGPAEQGMQSYSQTRPSYEQQSISQYAGFAEVDGDIPF